VERSDRRITQRLRPFEIRCDPRRGWGYGTPTTDKPRGVA